MEHMFNMWSGGANNMALAAYNRAFMRLATWLMGNSTQEQIRIFRNYDGSLTLRHFSDIRTYWTDGNDYLGRMLGAVTAETKITDTRYYVRGQENYLNAKFGDGHLGDRSDRGNNGFDIAKTIFEKGTFIPGTALSFVSGTKYGRWASMGGFKFNASPYSVQKEMIQWNAKAGNYIKNAGRIIGVGSLLFTAGDMYFNGVTTSNSIDLIMGGISFIPGGGWVIGGIYFLGNAILKETTGMDLGQHIDANRIRYQCPLE